MRIVNLWYVAVFFVCAMGVWGCSQQRTGAINAKITELETRYAKIEQDYRTLQTANDLNRKKITQLETQRAALEKDRGELNENLSTVTNERDVLRKQVAQRTQERDNAQANLVQFTKELQGLVGRVEAAMNNHSLNSGASIIPASRRND